MLKDKIKSLIAKGTEGKDNKKKIENMVEFIIILIITIIVINVIWNGDKKETKDDVSDDSKKLASVSENTVENTSNVEEDDMEKDLENILSKINGVGEVKVLITYSQTSQIIPIYNEETSQKDTEEKDTNGGERKTVEKDVKKDIIYKEENGEKVPITQSVVSPKIQGAIITAKGASNAEVKTNIIEAVEAVTRASDT